MVLLPKRLPNDKSMWRAGVEVKPNPMDFTLFYKNAQEHDFDMMLGGWGGWLLIPILINCGILHLGLTKVLISVVLAMLTAIL